MKISQNEYILGHSLEVNAKGDITFTLSNGQIELLCKCSQHLVLISEALTTSHLNPRPAGGLDSGVDCGETSILSTPLQPSGIPMSKNKKTNYFQKIL